MEEKVDPLVEAERKRIQSEQSTAVNKKLRERLDRTLKELNAIAAGELGKLTGGGNGNNQRDQKPQLPPNGFGFIPEYAYLQTGKPAGILLRVAIPDKLEYLWLMWTLGAMRF